jgi:glycerol-3-phosphate dehydrogenase
LINKGSRFLFITPWRGHSLIGTAYTLAAPETEHLQIMSQDIDHFLADINGAYPAAQLRPQDVSFVHGGFVPMMGTHPVTGDIQLAKHHQIRDHRQDGWHGLVSVVGVKYTTARYVAEKVVDHVFAVWEQRPMRSRSATIPLYGGGMEHYTDFLHTEIQRRPDGLTEDMVRHLVSNYGTAYTEVLSYVHEHRGAEGWAAVVAAEILYGIEHEMAQKLSDIVLRRTDLATAGHPGHGCLWECAKVMGSRLGWNQARMQQEIDEVSAIFPVCREQYHHADSRVASTSVQ